MSSVKVLLSVLSGGVAAGAILGILFAPDKGSNTRRKISKKSDEYSHELEVQFKSLIDSLKKENGKLKAEAEEVKNDFSKAVKM